LVMDGLLGGFYSSTNAASLASSSSTYLMGVSYIFCCLLCCDDLFDFTSKRGMMLSLGDSCT
jgi:hypothetical protein